MKLIIALFLLATTSTSFAQTYDWTLDAKVTNVEGGGVPSQVYFRIDRAAGTCAAGTFLFWIANGSDADTIKRNREAVYAMLLVAKTTGQTITIVGNNGTYIFA